MISRLPEKLDCLLIFPSSSLERVSDMPSSNSIWQLRRLNCLSAALEVGASSCQLPLESRGSPTFSRRRTASHGPGRLLHPSAGKCTAPPRIRYCSSTPSCRTKGFACWRNRGRGLYGVSMLGPHGPVSTVGRLSSREGFRLSSRLGLLCVGSECPKCECTGELPVLLPLCLLFLHKRGRELLSGNRPGDSAKLGLTGEYWHTPLASPASGLSSLQSLGTSSVCAGVRRGQWLGS